MCPANHLLYDLDQFWDSQSFGLFLLKYNYDYLIVFQDFITGLCEKHNIVQIKFIS